MVSNDLSQSCDDFYISFEQQYYNSVPTTENGVDWVVYVNITTQTLESIWGYCNQISVAEWVSKTEDSYSKPMVWIGIYIAVASFFCTLAMAADLWNGFRYRKFWFPSKYFSLNAVSITVIAVAMKLPMDLNTPMRGRLDQTTKLGSLLFMCTMIANIMPSLASMKNKELPANVIGLTILVITIIVNIIMEMVTRNITSSIELAFAVIRPLTSIYVAVLLFQLLVLISVAISVPTSKQILELKYQDISKTSLNDQNGLDTSIIERLRQHVTRYGIMVETGSPQFVMVGNVLSCASGIICGIGLVFYIMFVCDYFLIYYRHSTIFRSTTVSQYKWSIRVIFITQFMGVLVGSISPIVRSCSTVGGYKSFASLTKKHFLFYKIENYWTQKLYEWKESHITVLSSSPRSRSFFRKLKRTILSLWIGIQIVTVVTCKMICLIPVLLLILVAYCSNNLKCYLKGLLSDTLPSNGDTNLNNYVLLLEESMELAEETLQRISHSVNRLMQTAEKKQDKDLLKLLEKSSGFKGVSEFDIFQVEPPLSLELPNSWSLPIATLTCIAISLPNIDRDSTDNFLKSVGEGLSFTHLVDEGLNNACQYENVQKAAMTLWDEVEDKCKWLGNTLEKRAFVGKTAKEILEWFAHKADDIVNEVYITCNGEPIEKLPQKLIIAISMKRIAQTIISSHNISEITKKGLFGILSRMIADILFACFTNMPRVITMKCHEKAIEKRAASVEAAAKLLGRTTKIIEMTATRELPNMDPDKLAFIDEWRHHLQHIP